MSELGGRSRLKIIVDGAPAIAFVGAYVLTRDFRLATWCVVIGSALSLGLGLIVERRVAPLPAVSGALALIFGGLSLALKNNDFIKMKMTLVDGLLGAVLFAGLALGKNPLKAILGGAFSLPDHAWRTLTVRYAVFWWVCAAANEWVRRTQSDHTFVYFRGGVIVLAVIFAFAQTPFLLRHHVQIGGPPEPTPPEPSSKAPAAPDPAP
ncbi:MAG: septation protein IspZ [Alphaproteobacteria bacterium]|nr:septation protein IspZ [Alphaproteobacteria bacterium]